MKKTTKIIGSLGLMAALSVSVFAPVLAEGPTYSATPGSQDVTINLTVQATTAVVAIITPENSSTIVGTDVPVRVSYGGTNQLDYELYYIDNGTPVLSDEFSHVVAESGVATSEETFTLDLNEYHGYGEYILKVRTVGVDPAEASSRFNAVAFDFEPRGKEESTNNPIVTILESPGTKYSKMTVYKLNSDEKVLGPITVAVNENGETDVTLPFAQNNIPAGTYKVKGEPYDENDNHINADKIRQVTYIPATVPDVPDTGSFFADMNLSNSDLVSTGLAMLFLCVLFLILAVAKKTRKSRR